MLKRSILAPFGFPVGFGSVAIKAQLNGVSALESRVATLENAAVGNR